MSKKSRIKNPEMGDRGKSWNVVTGCDKYSNSCLLESNKSYPLHDQGELIAVIFHVFWHYAMGDDSNY